MGHITRKRNSLGADINDNTVGGWVTCATSSWQVGRRAVTAVTCHLTTKRFTRLSMELHGFVATHQTESVHAVAAAAAQQHTRHISGDVGALRAPQFCWLPTLAAF